MKLIKGGNNQCVIASLAMVLDLSFEEAIEELGHDGLQIVADSEPKPNCYRGVNPQELIDVCQRYNKALVMLETKPMMIHGSTVIDHTELIGKGRVQSYLDKFDAVIFGYIGHKSEKRGHCVAWNHKDKMIYDPRGYICLNSEESDFTPIQVFILQRIESYGSGLQ